MSTLGKILIVFNLLAAGAFVYFTLENWKARQEVSWAAFQRQQSLDGLGLEKPANPPSADELGDDRVAFEFTMPGNVQYKSINKDRYEKLLPPGGERFGGEPVAHQTAEVERLQKKVIAGLPAAGAPPAAGQPNRYQWLHAYLLSLARTGAERDGVNALLDLFVETRRSAARRDLPLLAGTSSQVAALKTLVEIADLGDPQAIMADSRASRVALAREAVRRFLLAEVPHGVGGTGDKAEGERALTNAVVDALRDRAGDAEKQAIKTNATGDAAGWEHLANVAVEPLTDKPSADRAMAALLAYADSKATTPTEKTALAGIKDLIVGLVGTPPHGFDLAKLVDSVATNHLNSKFDDAAAPAASGRTGKGNSPGEKARKIAHLLFHIDAWRHNIRNDQTVVADRKAWHERVAAVVGLPAYIRAGEAQATEYAEASQRLLAAITEEQSAFEAEYQAQLQRVLFLYSQWLALDNQVKAQDAITKENERLKEERETERNNLQTELADATQKAKEALEKLKTTQSKLFAIQKDLRDAQAAILTLEKELRRIELGTPGS
jgi:hypothetical protein